MLKSLGDADRYNKTKPKNKCWPYRNGCFRRNMLERNIPKWSIMSIFLFLNFGLKVHRTGVLRFEHLCTFLINYIPLLMLFETSRQIIMTRGSSNHNNTGHAFTNNTPCAEVFAQQSDLYLCASACIQGLGPFILLGKKTQRWWEHYL